LQHDLREQSYTIKQILDVAGRVLSSDLISIGLLKERVHYVLIRNGQDLDPAYIDELETYTSLQLSEHTGHNFGFDERLVFGRRKLRRAIISESGDCRFFGHPIFSGGNIIGHLSGLYLSKNNENGNPGLLSELTSQVALLLTNANLITLHEQYVTDLNSVLRAAVETTGINPEVGSSNKSFLLQFLLIVLELCRTDKGCAILFDDETQEIIETAVLGCDENAVLNMQVRSGLTIEAAFRKLIPVDLLNEPDNETCNIFGGKMVAPLVAGDKIMGGLVVLGLKSNVSPVITEAVQTLSYIAGNLIYNRILYQKNIKSTIIEEQLKLAHNIQKEVLPDKHPDLPGWDICGRSLPAKEVGGDLFDYFAIKGGKQGVTIADVCGKSIPASLLMTMTRAFLAAESDHFDKPDEILSNVNLHLSQRMAEGKFVTGCLAVIGDGGKIEYASAGHQPLLIYRASKGTFEELNADGIAMGILTDVDFECKEFEMNPGDITLMYTDGLNEAMNPDRVQFGFENIRKVMRENATESAEKIIDAYFNAIKDHADGAEQSDDTTIIVIKKTPNEVGDHD
ncbi:MAG: PP2C family protein-serine/threonine phosphatase, partial [bacterium]